MVIINFIKKNTVACIAFLLAAVTSFIVPPDRAYLDYFDLKDAFSKQENSICSKDLKKFIKDNHLDITNNNIFNPKVIFGSHSDQDHIYNTPRAWYMLKYFNPTTYDWINNPIYTPVSDNIPFFFVLHNDDLNNFNLFRMFFLNFAASSISVTSSIGNISIKIG